MVQSGMREPTEYPHVDLNELLVDEHGKCYVKVMNGPGEVKYQLFEHREPDYPEITPEMIKAGTEAIRECDADLHDTCSLARLEVLLESVYQAMERARFEPRA